MRGCSTPQTSYRREERFGVLQLRPLGNLAPASHLFNTPRKLGFTSKKVSPIRFAEQMFVRENSQAHGRAFPRGIGNAHGASMQA
jgi:hypothetical protein